MLVSLFWTKRLFLQDILFSRIILQKIKTVSFSQEFKCSGARKKFRTGTFRGIFNYTTQHLDLPVYYIYLTVNSLRIKKNATILTRKMHIPQKEHLKISKSFPDYLILQEFPLDSDLKDICSTEQFFFCICRL